MLLAYYILHSCCMEVPFGMFRSFLCALQVEELRELTARCRLEETIKYIS